MLFSALPDSEQCHAGVGTSASPKALCIYISASMYTFLWWLPNFYKIRLSICRTDSNWVGVALTYMVNAA